MRRRLLHYYFFWRSLLNRFTSEGFNYQAAALTFTSLLAVVPFMSVSFTVLSAFPVFRHLAERVQDLIFSHFIAASGNVIHHYIGSFIQQASRLSITGLIFLIITALLMIRTMEGALNTIWKIKQRRRGVSAFLLYWAMLTLAPILLGLSLVVSSYLLSLPFIRGTAHQFGLEASLLRLTALGLTALAFCVLYTVVPNTKVPLRASVPGAVFASVCFELAKKAFALYITHFPTYQMIYGTLATIPIFIIWVYFSWLIILAGALLSNMLAMRYCYQPGQSHCDFLQAYRWLGYFWQAQSSGQALSFWDLLKKDNHHTHSAPEQLLQLLQNANLIHPVTRDRYILSRDLNKISLLDFHQLLPWQLPNQAQLKTPLNQWESNLSQCLQTVYQCYANELNIPLAQLYSREA